MGEPSDLSDWGGKGQDLEVGQVLIYREHIWTLGLEGQPARAARRAWINS